MRDIAEIRAELDACDKKLMELLERRLGCSAEMIAYKKANGLPILQPEAEEQARAARLDALNGSPYKEALQSVFERIVKESRRVQSRGLFRCNIALIGFMGAGKSTVTACLKEMLAMDEVDTDALIVEQQHMSIKDIFEKYGEPYFRNCESDAILSLRHVQQTIISCGGGAVMRDENVQNLKKFSRIVLLTATPETTLARVQGSDERPILNGHMNVEFISQLMEKRAARYREAADVVIATDGKTVAQICEELIGRLVALEKAGV